MWTIIHSESHIRSRFRISAMLSGISLSCPWWSGSSYMGVGTWGLLLILACGRNFNWALTISVDLGAVVDCLTFVATESCETVATWGHCVCGDKLNWAVTFTADCGCCDTTVVDWLPVVVIGDCETVLAGGFCVLSDVTSDFTTEASWEILEPFGTIALVASGISFPTLSWSRETCVEPGGIWNSKILVSSTEWEGRFVLLDPITLPALWGDDPTGLGQRGGSSTAV